MCLKFHNVFLLFQLYVVSCLLRGLVAQMVNNPPAMLETWIWSVGLKIPWRWAWEPTPVFLPGESPRTEEPGGLQSMGSQRVGHDWPIKYSELFFFFKSLTFTHMFTIFRALLSFGILFPSGIFLFPEVLTLVFIVMVVMLYHWWNFFQLLYVWKNTLKYIFARYRNLDQNLFFFFSVSFPRSITILHHCHLIAFFQCEICYPYFTILKLFFSSGCF